MGIYTHKITLENEIYYIKEGCNAIQKGDKRVEISEEDIKIINDIINNNSVGEVWNEEKIIYTYNYMDNNNNSVNTTID